MATPRLSPPDMRKPAGSPRPKGRESSKDTLCRNVLIYGHCRYEDQGCAFNHDPNKTSSPPAADSSVKRLNVDSPAFTPAALPVSSRVSAISSAVNAAPFTPRALTSGTATPEPEPITFNPATIREFTPQNPAGFQTFEPTHAPNVPSNASNIGNAASDPFTMSNLTEGFTFAQHNPYLEDTTSTVGNGSTYYQTQTTFAAPQQPLQYHLYAPIGPHKEGLLDYQKGPHDFFISNDLREELQKKSEAAHQVMPNSQLPVVEQYHTLVPLDTTHSRNPLVFSIPSWVYKAMSGKNGQIYVLRRLEGFRLGNERAIRCVKEWKRVENAGVVSVIDAFTTQAFRDSSLIFVYKYHPMSKTLVEVHFTTNRFGRPANTTVPEQLLWGYITQLASAMKSVHAANLAVRCMDPSKLILTEKGRIRLSACSILDVVQFDVNRPIAELQQEDFVHLGKLILAIATNNVLVASPTAILKGPLDHLSRNVNYGQALRDVIGWLVSAPDPSSPKDINVFLASISDQVIAFYDAALQHNDAINSTLSGELENGRLVRLLSKLGNINERPEYENDMRWSEFGPNHMLKLFRDFVFHQVDANGNPVVDLGHIISCLNKLDAGSGQMIRLTSRDEQDVMLVTYKEVKKQIEIAWGELLKAGTAANAKRY